MYCDGVWCVICACLCMCLRVLFVDCCVLRYGACVSAMLLCSGLWSSLIVFVWFVCEICV